MTYSPSSHLCANAYFRNFRKPDWARDFLSLAKELARNLGVNFNYFSIFVEEKNQLLHSDQLYSFSGKNQEKLQRMLDNGVEFSGIDLYYSRDRDVVHHGILHAMITNEKFGKPYLQMYVQFQALLKPAHEHFTFMSHFFDTAENFLDIDYAFFTYMSPEKCPGFYFHDICVSSLEDREKQNLAQWISNQEFYPGRLRDFFEGNLFSKTHFDMLRVNGTDLSLYLNELDENSIRGLQNGKIFVDLVTEQEGKPELIKILTTLLIKPTGKELFFP
ncbi:MAG TPA: hypothetical protein PKW33_21385 [Anaerolineaceae bacterium]|nr:hypothetical protein [Anaerolineaceae bacterium]HPN54162.1 hypothetical protein [Anaerolineaceae bacterium]